MVVCGVVVAYAPCCASLSPNGLACEAKATTDFLTLSHPSWSRPHPLIFVRGPHTRALRMDDKPLIHAL